ncbi:MAG: DUF2232 domain-containing protein [Pseudolabrys sp.]
MMQLVLIGISAGAAAALLFASVTSGSWLSIALFYLAPLPLMIAGLGWSHWSALVGALFGASALGVIFGPIYFMVFVAGAGLPAWWLVYLAMLARPVEAGATAGGPSAASLEWYPPGRLVVWAAFLAAAIVLIAIPNFGLDGESFRNGLRETLTRMLRAETGGAADRPLSLPGVTNAQRVIEFMVAVIPPAAAVLATVTALINLWLAGRVVKFSGRLARPWPDLSAMTFPPSVGAALAGAVALSFFDGMIGILAGVLSASLLIAYGVLGLAVLHAITQGMSARPFLIGSVYAAVLVFGWPILLLCLLGIVDALIGLRARVARKRGPPTLS